jgi:hypothetical protein
MAPSIWDILLGGISEKWDVRSFSITTFFWAVTTIIWISANNWNWELIIDFLLKIKSYTKLLFEGQTELYFPIIIIILILLLLTTTSGIIDAFGVIFSAIIMYVFGVYWYLKTHRADFFKKSDLYGHVDLSHYRDFIPNKFYIIKEIYIALAQISPKSTSAKAFNENVEYIRRKYGIDPFIAIPILQNILPKENQMILSSGVELISTLGNLCIWLLAFSVLWSIWIWWLFPVALILVLIIFSQLSWSQVTYSMQLRNLLDLYHFNIYEALHWPLPTTTEQEKTMGQELNKYLMEGHISSEITFVHNVPTREDKNSIASEQEETKGQ